MNKYQELGFDNRRQYLESLAADYCLPLDVVLSLAEVLDFDGLISSLEDTEGMEW